MKLLRYGAPGAEKPGLLHDGQIRDLSATAVMVATSRSLLGGSVYLSDNLG